MGAWEALTGAVFALLGSLVFATARSFPRLAGGYPGPGLFPQLLGALLAVAGAALVVGGLTGRRPPGRIFPGRSRRDVVSALLVPAAVIFYLAAVNHLGFVVVSVVILGGLMAALGVRARWSALIGVGVTAVLYILFARILRVPLPEGVLGGLL